MAKASKNLCLFQDLKPDEAVDTLFFESTAFEQGYNIIAGVDEVGRGPLAGPVVAAAVVLPAGIKLPNIKDSKKMTEKARIKAFSDIINVAEAIGIGVVSHSYIDEFNILNASLEAMKKAVINLDIYPEYLLVDGIFKIPLSLPQKCIKKGDQLSHSISASSIIAKVYRDRIMYSYHITYPEYGFSDNKGYGTAKHLEAINKFGPCPVHRLTFRGVCQ
ncbi:MAG: ribonuclease HII [Deltaproteobacteria bacterium]|nr:ribonuclease HII [Deltaproteobacteria bacterium]